MSSKLFNILAVFVMLAMLLSACAQPAPAPAAPAAPAQAEATAAPAAKPAEQVEIRWRTRPDNQAEQDVYQKISDDLRRQLPQGIKLQYDPAPVTGYVDKLTTEFSAGTAPDIVWIPGASTADYASQGVILDLMPDGQQGLGLQADRLLRCADEGAGERTASCGACRATSPPWSSTTTRTCSRSTRVSMTRPSWPPRGSGTGTTSCAWPRRSPTRMSKIYGFSMSNWWGLWGCFVYCGGGSLFNADRTACGLTDPGSISGPAVHGRPLPEAQGRPASRC